MSRILPRRGLNGIEQLEEQLDQTLVHPWVPAADLTIAADQSAAWSRAVWREALAAGAAPLSQEQIARGLAIAARPIFVCGAHRSGTTLVQALFDDHPSLIVLPFEGTYLTRLEPRSRALTPEDRRTLFACNSLQRLANPVNTSPYWLLGRTSSARSPYVEYARAFLAWWETAQRHLGAHVGCWPLVAVTLAYGQIRGGFAGRYAWLEKTPTNERFLERLWEDFPDAKIVHVLRDPRAVFASDQAIARSLRARLVAAHQVLRELDDSFRLAAERRGLSDGRYLIVRYEDVLSDSAASSERLTAFVGIDRHPALLQPTVAGLPALPNSSFTPHLEPGRVHAHIPRRDSSRSWLQHQLVSAAVGEPARLFGYELRRPGRLVHGLLNLLRPARRTPPSASNSDRT
jgi:hypothetical protein